MIKMAADKIFTICENVRELQASIPYLYIVHMFQWIRRVELFYKSKIIIFYR